VTRWLLVFFSISAAQARLDTRLQTGAMPSIEVAFRGVEALPAGDLVRAKDLAAAILSRAGVHVQWSAARGAIQMHILAAAPAGLHPDAAGFAVLRPENYAAVCWPGVVRTANSLAVEPWTVLGATIAHELGHLLLQSKTHSSGVMSYRFDLPQMRAAQRGELLFSAADARLLRNIPAAEPPRQ
jgi:hypothetical protein